MIDYEKLGAFYLGKIFDAERGEVQDDLLLYDSKDLTTHAVCVGMTGSGKTGLCVSLLEEAAIDGIPALVIDPKGDLGNLFLTFPDLLPEDFEPWVDAGSAARKGLSPAEFARSTAALWRKGLADWGQDGERIRRLRAAADFALYTPGSASGRPLRVLRSFAAPTPELLADPELLRDRIDASTSGLLSMLGLDADPIQSREHILISNLLDRGWREGRDLELGSLIQEIQSPPFEKLGVLDLESFFPAQERFALAMRLNNLLASPGFGAWLEGEPLDVGRLLTAPDGRPRISVLSIGHLSDPERMFFVTLLLGEVTSWMRAQPGTSSLRALLYMDEVFGYFPPSASPPSKRPMLGLLKQARAYGLGVVLATQNPVDLDYKGLSNTGTWFLGRLQTERDKARVLDGLEGASTASGAAFDRAQIERILSGLRSRVFLQHNVHEDHPVLFHTRWALSYLRGPLTRDQIRTLARQADARPSEPGASGKPTAEVPPPHRAPAPAQAVASAADRPLVEPGVSELIFERAEAPAEDASLVYRPALYAAVELHYTHAASETDEWRELHYLALLGSRIPSDPWTQAEPFDEAPTFTTEPDPAGKFASLASGAGRAKSFSAYEKRLETAVYRDRRLPRWRCKRLKLYSAAGEDEADFRARVELGVRERRDLAVEKLRARHAPKLRRLQERIASAEGRLEVEREQHRHQKLSTLVSVGATVLGAVFGRKTGAVGRAATAARGASRTLGQRSDVRRAAEKIEDLREQLAELDARFEDDRRKLEDDLAPERFEITPLGIRPRKSDISITRLALAWLPYTVTPDGIAEPAFETR